NDKDNTTTCIKRSNKSSKMVSRIWGSNPFDELVEKATSELLPKGQEDLALNLDISDQIRSKSVPAKDAMKALKKRIDHSNPNVQLLALNLTDTCVKNGGHHFLIEIASREFVDNLVVLLMSPNCNHEVRSKLLHLIQTWGIAFDGKPELSFVSDTYRLLKEEYTFPKLEKATSSVIIDTETPPEWTDSDVCTRCRTQFTTFNRKHHCRNCGQTFCGDCSSKTMALPHIGINDPVRVCDSCHMKRQLKARSIEQNAQNAQKTVQNSLHSHTNSLPNGRSNTTNSSNAHHEDDDDEDYKKAIELSLKEAESSRGFPSSKQNTTQKVTEPSQEQISAQEQEAADLEAAIAASLQEMNLNRQSSSIHTSNYSSAHTGYDVQSYKPSTAIVSSNELSAIESENIQKFSEIVERIQQSGSDLMRDRQVQELYERIGELKPKLTKTLSESIQKHQDLVDMHEKLSQVVKLYDRLLEESISSAYTRRGSTMSHFSQRVNSIGAHGVGPLYPNLNAAAQTSSVYHQLNYPIASAPASSPTYYPSQSLIANQQYSNQIDQQALYSQQCYNQHVGYQSQQQEVPISGAQVQPSNYYQYSQQSYGQNYQPQQLPPHQSQQIEEAPLLIEL
ncbi:8495_t:CDS:10, partial [Ambispora leptoticha]